MISLQQNPTFKIQLDHFYLQLFFRHIQRAIKFPLTLNYFIRYGYAINSQGHFFTLRCPY